MALIETHLPTLSEEAHLVGRLQTRAPGAFEELLDTHQQPIFRFVSRLLDDPSEAADVTQEVFIKVFQKIDRFRGDCSLKTWIYRIAVNEASNRRRWFSRHRRRESSVDAMESLNGSHPDSLTDGRDTPFESAYRREQMVLIKKALLEMDERLRYAVILRDLEDLSYNEIADIMQVSLGTVKSRILRGREALKLRLQRLAPAEGPEACALQPE